MKLPGIVAIDRVASEQAPRSLKLPGIVAHSHAVCEPENPPVVRKLPILLGRRCSFATQSSCSSSPSSSPSNAGSDVGDATEFRPLVVDLESGQDLDQGLGEEPLSREDFEALCLLGVGGFGEVKLVRCWRNGRHYAMKAVEKADLREQKLLGDVKAAERLKVERDVSIAARDWACPFIVKLHATFQSPLKLYFVYEYCPGGELLSLVRAQPGGRLEEDNARFYLAELVVALTHLHDHEVLHRDIKLENVLLDACGHVRLADFGCARQCLPGSGTKSFMAIAEPELFLPPEVFRANGSQYYGKEVDCWQLGVVAFAMMAGAYPSRPPGPEGAGVSPGGNFHWPGELPPNVSTKACGFCFGLLALDRQERLGYPNGASVLTGHTFFDSIDWTALVAKEIEPPFDGDHEELGMKMCVRKTLQSASTEASSGQSRIRGFSWSPGMGAPDDEQKAMERLGSIAADHHQPPDEV